MLMCMCRAVPASALVSAEYILALKTARDCSWSCFTVLYMGKRGAPADDAVLQAAQLVSCHPRACACIARQPLSVCSTYAWYASQGRHCFYLQMVNSGGQMSTEDAYIAKAPARR